MIVGIADTHAALWYFYDSDRLSGRADAFITQSAIAGRYIGISAIRVAEVVYLVEKARLVVSAHEDLQNALDSALHVFKEVPFTADIASAMRAISRTDVPDMPDRIIAATAVHLKVPLISRDGRIRASKVQTIW